MSVIRTVNLWCDHLNCATADAYSNGIMFTSATAIRADAREWGWTRRQGNDYCPDHSAPVGDQAGGEQP